MWEPLTPLEETIVDECVMDGERVCVYAGVCWWWERERKREKLQDNSILQGNQLAAPRNATNSTLSREAYGGVDSGCAFDAEEQHIRIYAQYGSMVVSTSPAFLFRPFFKPWPKSGFIATGRDCAEADGRV